MHCSPNVIYFIKMVINRLSEGFFIMIWDKWTDIDKNTLFIDFSLCLILLFKVDIYKTI